MTMKKQHSIQFDLQQVYYRRAQTIYERHIETMRELYTNIPSKTGFPQILLSEVQKQAEERLMRLGKYLDVRLSGLVQQASPREPASFDNISRKILIAAFQKNNRPNEAEKYALAAACRLEYSQVCVWFSNRRTRHGISRVVTGPKQGFKAKVADRKTTRPQHSSRLVNRLRQYGKES